MVVVIDNEIGGPGWTARESHPGHSDAFKHRLHEYLIMTASLACERIDHPIDCLCSLRAADHPEYRIELSRLGAIGPVLEARTATHADSHRTPQHTANLI